MFRRLPDLGPQIFVDTHPTSSSCKKRDPAEAVLLKRVHEMPGLGFGLSFPVSRMYCGIGRGSCLSRFAAISTRLEIRLLGIFEAEDSTLLRL